MTTVIEPSAQVVTDGKRPFARDKRPALSRAFLVVPVLGGLWLLWEALKRVALARGWIESPPPWLKRFGLQCSQLVSVLLLGVPRPLGYWVSDRFGDYFYRRNIHLRANVEDNLQHVFGADVSDARMHGATQRVFRMQARNGFDLLRVPRVSLKRLDRQTRVDGNWAEVDAILAEGRGVILVTAHYGAFDIMGQYIAHRGYDAWLLVGRTTSRFVHDAVTYMRQSRGWHVEQVEEPNSVRHMLKALKDGKLVGMALSTNAEIFTIMTPRLPGDRYGFTIRHVPLQRIGNREAAVTENMRRILANLETTIAADPGQWVLFRRVWHDTDGT